MVKIPVSVLYLLRAVQCEYVNNVNKNS